MRERPRGQLMLALTVDEVEQGSNRCGPGLAAVEVGVQRIRFHREHGEVCAARAVPFTDVAAALSCDEIWSREVAAGDAYHPSARGYKRLAALIEDPLLSWLESLRPGRSHP